MSDIKRGRIDAESTHVHVRRSSRILVKQNKDRTGGSNSTRESAVSTSEASEEVISNNVPLENSEVLQQVVSCPEVLNSVFTHMTLVEQINSRLVCKSWNEELCRILKKTCVARTEKFWQSNRENDTISEFKKVVERGAKLKLPCPFGGVEVKLSPEDSAEVEAISQKLNLPVVSLSFKRHFQSPNFDCYYDFHEVFATAARSLIKSCSLTLTYLKTCSWGTSSAAISSPMGFPKLETLSLHFKDNSHNAEEVREDSNQDEAGTGSSEAEPGGDTEKNPNPGDGGASENPDDEDLETAKPPEDKQTWRQQAAYFIKLNHSSPNLKRLKVKVESYDSNPDAQNSILQLLDTADLNLIQNLTLELRDKYVCKNPATVFTRLGELESRDLRTLSVSVGGGPFIWEIEPLDPNVLARSINGFSHSLRTLNINVALAVEQPMVFSHYPCLTTLELPGVDFRALDLRHLSDLKHITIGVENRAPACRQLKSCGSIETVRLSEPRSGLRGLWGRDEKANTVVAGQLFKKFPNAKNWYVSTAFLPAFADYARARKKCVEKLSVHYTRPRETGYISAGALKGYYDEATEACSHLSQLSSLRELAVSSPWGMDLGRIDLSELPNLEVLTLSVNSGDSYSVLKTRIEELRKLKRVILFHSGSKFSSVPKELRALPNVITVKT